MKAAYAPAAAPPLNPSPHFELTMGFLPWRRYFARTLDTSLYMILVGMPLYGAVGSKAIESFPDRPPALVVLLVAIALILPLSGLITALLLSVAGTTPGKWLFGVRIRGAGGGKLSFGRALKREWLVWVGGYGLGIPGPNLVAAAIAYGYIETNHETWWDRRTGSETTYREGSTVQYLLWTALVIAIQFRGAAVDALYR